MRKLGLKKLRPTAQVTSKMMPRGGHRGRGGRRGQRGHGQGGRVFARDRAPQPRVEEDPNSGYNNAPQGYAQQRNIRGRSDAPRRPPRRRPTGHGFPSGLQILDELMELEDDVDQLVVKMSERRSHLQRIVNYDNIQDDGIRKLILLFGRACLSSVSGCVINVISVLSQSTFLEKHLPRYLLFGCATQTEDFRRDVAIDLLTLFEEYMSRFPSQIAYLSIDSLAMFATRLEKSDELQRKLSAVNAKREEIVRKILETRESASKHAAEQMHPPDDFRQIPTCPNAADINRTEAPFLRAIKSQGEYQDGEHYLDVQFRLLREDLVAPLREGVVEIRREMAYKERKHRLKTYTGVNLLFPLYARSGVLYRLNFSLEGIPHVQWERSKRLIFGSLLCLSKDDFASVIFATVAERDAKQLSLGLVDVAFLDRAACTAYMRGSPALKMVESESYFEAYRHVLDVLKGMDVNNIPMARYIVEASVNVNVPRYLDGKINPTYNLSKVLSYDKGDQIHILNSSAWPGHEKTIFNASQMQAIEHALTKEFVLIQGPPGTGKTFVGLRIAQAILENKRWRSNSQVEHAPVLVVCYTNHALDQFLSGLISAGFPNLLRVGGRASEELQGYTLQAARTGKHRHLNGTDDQWILAQELKAIQREKSSAYHRMKHLQEDAEPLTKTLDAWTSMAQKGKLVSFPKLRFNGCISEDHAAYFEPLERECKSLGVSVLEIFLELIRIPVESLRQLQREEEETVPFAEPEEVDDLIDVQEDEDILLDRFWEEADLFRGSKSKQKKSAAKNKDEKLVFIDSEGFRYVQQKYSKRAAKVKSKFSESVPMSYEEVDEVVNPWELHIDDKWRLYFHWINVLSQRCIHRIEATIDEYEEACADLNTMEMVLDEKRFLRVDLIGMTTSCAARYYDVLNRIRPRVVIVEEAAEVLEAHVVTALTAGAEHVVLIGDHKQLRPNPSVYDLATKYNLSLSLFERMVRNKMECITLDIQHRMRPEFARLLRHIYPKLDNHPSVQEYDDVLGVEKNLFFVNHHHSEVEDEGLRSKANHHEALIIKGLCQYLIKQGYGPHEITILTGYTGQVMKIRSLMPRSQFEGVKITAVDNFQGEENEIILLSLVRSNAKDKIGFWKADNRTCVALSRAKKGMYVIGNFDLFSKQSLLWARIIKDAQSAGCYGDGIVLTCQNHPEAKTKVRIEADFANAPDGGCMLPCDYRLPCGHVCPRACHPNDKDHVEFRCRKKCPLTACDSGHACPDMCHHGVKCRACVVPVMRTLPRCGHTQFVPCSADVPTVKCTTACPRKLRCGHACRAKCGDPCTRQCAEPVEKLLPCGHKGTACCSEDASKAKCIVPCGELLKCGHQCSGTCGACKQGRLHKRCDSKCDRLQICSHLCKQPCPKVCPPCTEPCENECPHSKCPAKCMSVCVPCTEPCTWSCPHQRCGKLCSEICDREPCNQPCKRLLKCKHPCIGLCWEPCPLYCRVCDEEEVTSIFFGTEDEPEARFVQLVDCKHILEVSGMDAWMEVNDGGLGLKTCPRCKTPIRRSLRYTVQVKKALHDINEVKRKMNPDFDLDVRRENLFQKLKNDLGSDSSLHLYFCNSFKELESVMKQEKAIDRRANDAYGYDYELLRMLTNSKHVLSLSILSNQVALICSLRKLRVSIRSHFTLLSLENELRDLEKYVMSGDISEEQLDDAALELHRLQVCSRALVAKAEARYEPELARICRDLQTGRRHSDEALKKFEEKLAAITSTCPLTEQEKVMVIRAMGLQKGHWFKCPNGHYYAIGECGGAMQTGRCPECNATIGGGNHALAPGNRHAGEFDGSQHASWSEAANMLNFDLLNLH